MSYPAGPARNAKIRYGPRDSAAIVEIRSLTTLRDVRAVDPTDIPTGAIRALRSVSTGAYPLLRSSATDESATTRTLTYVGTEDN